MSIILATKELFAGYGESIVLFDINIELKAGETVFLVGKNGAGKTTLFKTISGFIKPKRGNIVFSGEDITGLPPHKIAKMGIRLVFQDKRVISSLSVKDNLLLASLDCKLDAAETIKKALELFPELKPFLETPAGALSGGQRQMLTLAYALLCKPRLLMIDEPTEGFSGVIIKRIRETFKKLREQGVTLFIAEQNIPLVTELADKVYIIKEGKIIATLEGSNIATEKILEYV
jgi:branched-chain amino acid transport system ATP-binding protein